jgi:hypothetical protein
MKLYLTTFFGIIFCGIVLYFFVSFEVFSNDIEVPIPNQLPILQKLLATENNFKKSNRKEIIAGVIYQPNNKISNNTKKEIFLYASNEKMMIGNATLKFIPINIEEDNNIHNILVKEKCHLLIITQLRSINYKDILKYSSGYSVLTFATNADIMRQNKISIAIDYKSNIPQPIINLKTLEAESFSFPSQVLKYIKPVD